MIKIDDYSADLEERDEILFSKNKREISYPESGNEHCFQLEENSFWFNHRNRCIIEGVLKYHSGGAFFDIGGGNGFVTKGLKNNNIPTVLVEPGIQGCINAKKRGVDYVICSTLEDASLIKNTIPAIGLFDVVEHIENDTQFLGQIRNLLVDNGLVFITVPAFQWLWSNEDVDAGHFRRYSRKEIEAKLKAAGFKIEYSTYIFSILVAAVFLFRALPSKLGLNKGSNSLEKHKKEHQRKSGAVDKVLNIFWNNELKRIRKGKPICIGGSCFIIARKEIGN